MRIENSHHLLDRLREVDEYHARQHPAREAEFRLLARWESGTSVAPRAIPLSWNTIKRPLVILAACVMLLATSLHDEIRRVSRIHFRPVLPSVPAASTSAQQSPPQRPRHERPRFHDTIAPMPHPTPNPSNTIDRSLPVVPRRQSPRKNDVDLSWPQYAPQTSPPEFRRWKPLAKPDKTDLFETSPTQWYWPNPPASKSENPNNFWGGSSSTKVPRKQDENAESHEPHESAEPAVCQSPDALKQAAYLDCSEQGLTLADFKLLEPCGDNQFLRETHECAETEIEACVTDTLGDGKTCEDPGLMKTLAYETCTAAGQQLTDLVFDFGDCNGMVRMAKFTCCTPDLPPPNTPSCHEAVPLNDSMVCRDPGLMKQEAWETCNAEGTYLLDYKAWGDCPPGQASNMIVTCCDP